MRREQPGKCEGNLSVSEVVLQVLFRGPVLSLFAMAGWATHDKAELMRERHGDAALKYERSEGALERAPGGRGGGTGATSWDRRVCFSQSCL